LGERLQTNEKGNNDNLDKYLSADNLPLSGLQIKVVIKPTLETSSKEFG